MNKEDKPIYRVQYFAREHLKLSVSKFEQRIGVNRNAIQSAIDRGSSMTDTTLLKIHEAFPELNMIWILSGKGEMLLPNYDHDEHGSKELMTLVNAVENRELSNKLRNILEQLIHENAQLKSRLNRIYKLSGETE